VTAAEWMPVVFMAVMGLSMLAYVLLDGFDLGVGMLMHRADAAQRDLMIASIGPFWDANETWLVLGVGILLIAFPKAHGVVLSALYLPVALMLLGLTLRGVAFDFRVKARDRLRPLWNRAFIFGSSLAALAQGWMLARYITGFASDLWSQLFALLIAIALPAAYVLLGACWLIMKTDGEVQRLAVRWARLAGRDRHGPDIARHTDRERDRPLALVHDAGIHCTAADSTDHRIVIAGGPRNAQLLARDGQAVLVAIRRCGAGVPDGRHRPGL
jgi:cytochrome d ubiquinol oxidase subunit II